MFQDEFSRAEKLRIEKTPTTHIRINSVPEHMRRAIYHFANDWSHKAGFHGNVALAVHAVGLWGTCKSRTW